jgi:pyruvate/2-oxoacid:ferredoxin oxidoreductase beta subunit
VEATHWNRGCGDVFALTFCMAATGEDGAVKGARQNPEYVVPSDPYLPIRTLTPAY